MRACGGVAALVLLTLSAWPAGASGTYYRWIDASGTPVNSDRPPPAGTEYEVVSATTNRMHVDAAEGSTAAPEVENGTNNKIDAAQAPAQPRYKKDPEACANARENLEVLKTHARIRLADGNGNYRYIGQAEKEAELAKAEAIIAKNCA